MKSTKALAKKYGLIIWNYRRKTGANFVELMQWLREKHPDIYNINNSSKCGYCLLYIDDCKKCPLYKIWSNNSCFSYKSPFYKFSIAKTKRTRKKYAEQIYQDIKRS